MTLRRSWRLQEGCLEYALIGGVIFAFFSLSELRRRKTIFSSLLDLGQQATTATYFSSTSIDVFSSISSQVFCLNFMYSYIANVYFILFFG